MPAPRSVAPQQTSVAVATREAPTYSGYALSPYAQAGVPYAPLADRATKRRRSRTVKVVSVLGVILAILFVVGVVANVQDKAATENAVAHTSIQLPDEAAGLQKLTGALADQLNALDASQPGLQFVSHMTGGYALADGKPRAVVIIGKLAVESRDFAAGVAAEEKGAHNAEKSLGIPSTTFTKVAAGPLGGEMACGLIQYPTVNGTQCLFVDRAVSGSITMLDIEGLDGSTDHAIALQLRGAVETRT